MRAGDFQLQTDETAVRDALRYVIAPELGINIVDLGLVYSIRCDGYAAEIEMTMTTPACPMAAYLQEEARATVLRTLPVLREATVSLVWAHAWKPEMMSAEAKRQLGWTAD